MPNYELLNVLSNKKVLCADDEPMILKELSELLELFFKEVVAVNDGEQALEEAMFGSFDVLIFDVSMPKMDGLEAIRQIREKNKKIPIIVLSAHTEQEYLWRAVDLKIAKYLVKPYDKDTFLKALELIALELSEYNSTLQINENLSYNYGTQTISTGKNSVQLTKSESRLLEYFLNHKGKIIVYDELLDYMWDYNQPTKEALKALVKELRKKIDKSFIKNVYGLGYKCEF